MSGKSSGGFLRGFFFHLHVNGEGDAEQRHHYQKNYDVFDDQNEQPEHDESDDGQKERNASYDKAGGFFNEGADDRQFSHKVREVAERAKNAAESDKEHEERGDAKSPSASGVASLKLKQSLRFIVRRKYESFLRGADSPAGSVSGNRELIRKGENGPNVTRGFGEIDDFFFKAEHYGKRRKG